MTDSMERLARLRGAPVQPAEADPLEQFRRDFAAVWKWRRHCGYISQDEMQQGKEAAAAEVRQNMKNDEWMDVKMQEYAKEAEQMRADIARSERIRAEVRAEREAA